MGNKICAMITLFNPNIDKTSKNISEILKYAERVYLLFNSEVKTELIIDERVVPIDNKRNIGLSKAFNIAFDKATEDKFDLTILFDQDSLLTIENFNVMYSEFIEASNNNKVMCIGPALNVYGNLITTPKWMKWKKIDTKANVDSVKNIITSGMIINIAEALKIGAFDDSFPVDFCDFNFCYRALYHGYYVLRSKDAFIQHEIGKSSMKIGKITIHFHAPYRNYFLVRDTLRIVFRCKETPLSIRIRYLFFLPLRMILFIMLLDKKRERLNMYYLGFKDYINKNYYFGSIQEKLSSEKK